MSRAGADREGLRRRKAQLPLVPRFIPLGKLKSEQPAIIAKPNAACRPETANSDPTAALRVYGDFKSGVKLAGGCCGTTPSTISAVRSSLETVSPERRITDIPASVCSATKAVPLDRVRIIGERINPTGKKRFKEALKNKDIDYILTQAIEQTNAGADILDVNVGMPDIDEEGMMVECVDAIQGVSDAPLQLDSSDPKALEAGLRHYHGKAIVNSERDPESLDTVLPIVKKYGAAVVGLTLDKNGIPPTALQRLAIAQRIL